MNKYLVMDEAGFSIFVKLAALDADSGKHQ